jgi:hypothetical protein
VLECFSTERVRSVVDCASGISRRRIVIFTSDDWRTPIEVLELVFDVLGDVDNDPCAAKDPDHHFARNNWTEDGLEAVLVGNSFGNPPYSWTSQWVKFFVESSGNRMMLIPPATGTIFWHEHIFPTANVCFWKGRMEFLGPEEKVEISKGVYEYDPSTPWVPYKQNRYESSIILWPEDPKVVERFRTVFGKFGAIR